VLSPNPLAQSRDDVSVIRALLSVRLAASGDRGLMSRRITPWRWA